MDEKSSLIACIAKKGGFIAGTFDVIDEVALAGLAASAMKLPNVKRAWVKDDAVWVERHELAPLHQLPKVK